MKKKRIQIKEIQIKKGKILPFFKLILIKFASDQKKTRP